MSKQILEDKLKGYEEDLEDAKELEKEVKKLKEESVPKTVELHKIKKEIKNLKNDIAKTKKEIAIFDDTKSDEEWNPPETLEDGRPGFASPGTKIGAQTGVPNE